MVRHLCHAEVNPACFRVIPVRFRAGKRHSHVGAFCRPEIKEMDRQTQLEIFRAQTENVRGLEKAWKHLLRTINKELVSDNLVSAAIHTKLLSLVFCAWSEANFQKVIHTPHCLELDEINQIKAIASKDIVNGWLKCLDLGLNRVSKTPKSSYIPNIKQSVVRIIHNYVHEPRLLRNKIAHGQWVIALNRDNDAKNEELTKQVNEIDVVKLSIWKAAYCGLSNIIECLIESPDRAFHRDYWVEVTNVNKHLRETENWTLESKIKQLKRKASYFKK